MDFNDKNLEERTKELNCLHNFSRLIRNERNNLEKILKGIVTLLPAAFQFPADAGACITYQGQEFKTQKYESTPWKITSHLELYGEQTRTIEVCYHKPPLYERDPFQKEEKLVLETIAVHLSRVTEQIQANEDLQRSRNQLSRYFRTRSGR